MASFRIEAESMALSGGYVTETNSSASNSRLIVLNKGISSSGTASTLFQGQSGYYDVIIGYYDENDGTSQLSVRHNNTELSKWSWDLDLGYDGPDGRTFQTRKVASGLSIKAGDTFSLLGTYSGSERARVDYIEFVAVGAPANNPSPVANYSQASEGVIVDLSEGFAARLPRILPLGDSITYGMVEVYTGIKETGGYRTVLWNKLIGDNRAVNFVGSKQNGPSTLGDRDHEGNSGRTIDWTAERIDGFLSSSQPDYVLLMLGTNDIEDQRNSIPVLESELSNLIDRILSFSSNINILVASIPPIRSDAQPAEVVNLAKQYNEIIPGVVASKQTSRVKFVDMRSLTEADISPRPKDNGLHPTFAGYEKIGNLWYEALNNESLFNHDRAELKGIDDIIGSRFQDRLVGDSGANTIRGGAGSDWLTGGGGPDKYVYKTPTEGGDVITDFSGDDVFYLSAAGFKGGLAEGISLSNGVASSTGVFVKGSSPIGTSGNFLYSNGILRYDQDGTGSLAAVTIAELRSKPDLSITQFVITA